MSESKNKNLYKEVKTEVFKKHPKHSAYRLDLLVQEYKARRGKYIDEKNSEKRIDEMI